MSVKVTENIIIGIDPGTNLLGYGVLSFKDKQASVLAMGVIDMRKCKDVHEKLGRMLKLGRAQGVAIAAAISAGIKVYEYAPRKIKMAITGQGNASKEQVSTMLQRMFNLNGDAMLPYLDATDAMAAAYCHYIEMQKPITRIKSTSNWKEFVAQNASRIVNPNKK